MPTSLRDSVAMSKLWVDGVGCYLLCLDKMLILGNANPANHIQNRVGIVADLTTEHVALDYEDGCDWITPRHETTLDGVQINIRTRLCHGAIIGLGESVQLRYSVASPLSNSATINLESGHRFTKGIDGIVLFRQTCLLGAGLQKHIHCRDWAHDVVLFSKNELLFCKTVVGEIVVDREPRGRVVQVASGQHLQGDDWSIRIEAST